MPTCPTWGALSHVLAVSPSKPEVYIPGSKLLLLHSEAAETEVEAIVHECAEREDGKRRVRWSPTRGHTSACVHRDSGRCRLPLSYNQPQPSQAVSWEQVTGDMEI